MSIRTTVTLTTLTIMIVKTAIISVIATTVAVSINKSNIHNNDNNGNKNNTSSNSNANNICPSTHIHSYIAICGSSFGMSNQASRVGGTELGIPVPKSYLTLGPCLGHTWMASEWYF